MELDFTIDDEHHLVSEAPQGWVWEKLCGCGCNTVIVDGGYFTSPHEAQQAALWAHIKRQRQEAEDAEEDEEDRRYGTYRQQVRAA